MLSRSIVITWIVRLFLYQLFTGINCHAFLWGFGGLDATARSPLGLFFFVFQMVLFAASGFRLVPAFIITSAVFLMDYFIIGSMLGMKPVPYQAFLPLLLSMIFLTLLIWDLTGRSYNFWCKPA